MRKQKSYRRENTYEIKGDITYVYDQQNRMFIIDTECLDFVRQHYWSVGLNGYVMRPKDKKTFHRLLVNAPMGKVVDHINHNKGDNRLSNLRICSYTENQCNRITNKNNKYDSVKGIHQIYNGRYRAVIIFERKVMHLGYFDTLEEARIEREKAEIRYFGEYRCGVV